ncbi:helix-turn-helix domain-containing protein [Limosilactobacillus albertensis]|uniref:Helix-turn-helix transcriptional regulator n=1 Tax=Limosilactobacillus albertensis TaxID=2759752 RepID=A0A839H861_9LACO|nr:helix-turn-helix transcriptional regulator [Limosilactobacillus albertensis]MBB1122867.1 helix-turn-helix transcriptional regulator [Limosilactobacillus albertensis]MCD7122446.1 helix-turn-helix domain-containing protein [Limosilactobacillus albertensis]
MNNNYYLWILQTENDFYNRPKLSNEEFEKKLANVWGDEFKLAGNYNGYDNPVYVYHKKCDKVIFISRAGNLLKGQGCRQCYWDSLHKKRLAEGKKKFVEWLGEDFTLISEYKGCDKKVIVKANKCGHVFKTSVRNLQLRKMCKVCYGKRKYPYRYTIFGSWLLKERQRLGISQETLSTLSGVDNALISHIENGQYKADEAIQNRLKYYLEKYKDWSVGTHDRNFKRSRSQYD